jgi:hypothetical protein
VSEPTAEQLVTRLEAVVDALERQTRHDLPLDVAAVKARYGLADDRTARALMHEVGALRIGGRLFVRLSDLERLEAASIERPSARPRQAAGRRQHGPGRRGPVEQLEPGFWRE